MKRIIITLCVIAASSIISAQNISGEYYDWTKTMKPEREWIRDYNSTIVSKLFLCSRTSDGEVKQVYQTFEQALETIRKYDNVTLGIPKIVYLVGWQFTGHDSGYPSWGKVNESLKRTEDPTAEESLRWLIREARQYNTTVSLHINMFDAFENSPLWDKYLKEDIIAKDKNGTPLKGEVFDGMQSFQISYAREWDKGYTVKRIDALLKMLPELIEGGTIHIDAFHTVRPVAQKDNCVSPFLSYTLEDETAAQRKIFRYWRSKGLDVTSEGFLFLRIDPFIGLQPMTWNYWEAELDADWKYKPKDFERLPSNLAAHTPIRFEQEMRNAPDNFAPIINRFAYNAVKWYFIHNDYSTADCDVLINENEIFCPIGWKKGVLLAVSRTGFNSKEFRIPSVWGDINKVNINKITTEGLQKTGECVVSNGKIVITTEADSPIVITTF